MIPAKYLNTKGQAVDLNANGIVTDVGKLLKWSLDVSDKNGRISSLTMGVQEKSTSCSTYTPEARTRLYEVPAVDVMAGTPGRLYVGDWYLSCYLTSSETSKGSDASGLAEYTIKVTSDDPWWCRDTETVITERHEGGAGLDYPYDYEHDFGYAPSTVVVKNDNFTDADLLIRVYGPCSDPSVTIGANVYGVAVDLAQGDYLEVDTRGKTVVVTRLDGDEENAFPKVTGEYMRGSGSYVFEQLPPGEADVVWPGTYDLDVVVTERRAEPRWW